MMTVLPALSLSCHDNQVVNEGHLQEDIAAVRFLLFPLDSSQPSHKSHDSGTLVLPFMHFQVIGN